LGAPGLQSLQIVVGQAVEVPRRSFRSIFLSRIWWSGLCDPKRWPHNSVTGRHNAARWSFTHR